MSTIAANLTVIQRRIQAAAERSGRNPADITLAAVSKMHSEADIREAYAQGQRHFAENYAQHLRDKAAALCDLSDIRWHFVGHLQRNKIKYVIAARALIETVDSAALAGELDLAAGRAGVCLDCLVQVNIGRETQKSGVSLEEVEPVLTAVESANHLRLQGLMTIPPYDWEPEETRKHFSALRKLRDSIGGIARLPHLSMGMSGDYPEAVEEGATIVRVGTALFGNRN